MKVIDAGHEYVLDEVGYRPGHPQHITFVKNQGKKYPGNIGFHGGILTQELLRVCIDRTRYLNSQGSCMETEMALAAMRQALVWYEVRAARCRHDYIEGDHIDTLDAAPTCPICGHCQCHRTEHERLPGTNRCDKKETAMNIYELHQKMTAHLFPSYSNTDVRFLTLAICGEAGELANMIKKRWRDNVDLTEQCRDEIADIRVYLELLAKCFDIEGSKLDDMVQDTGCPVVVDEHWLSLVLCSRTGSLAGLISNSQLFGEDPPAEPCKDAVVGIRITLENLAKQFGIGGVLLDQRVEQKLVKVVIKHQARLDSRGSEHISQHPNEVG